MDPKQTTEYQFWRRWLFRLRRDFLADILTAAILTAILVWALVATTAAHAAVRVYGPYQISCTHTWSQNLAPGTTSPDVRNLQAFLNFDPATQVAAYGPGSPGQETDYFGTLTKIAVERFQDKYALDVLFPLKIYAPTGYFGPATRLEANLLCE